MFVSKNRSGVPLRGLVSGTLFAARRKVFAFSLAAWRIFFSAART
jgi:hypothetical protein